MNEPLRQRQPRVECRAFLAFVRRRPCCVCGAPAPSHAAHVRMGCPERGERDTGKGERPSDRRATPLCGWCHLDAPDAQHRGDERAFWARVGLDPFAIAADLYAQFLAMTKFRFRKAVGESVRKLKSPRPVNRIGVTKKIGAAISAQRFPSRPIPRRANPWPTGRKFGSRR